MIGKKSVIKINDLMMYLAVAVQHLRLMALLVCFSMLCGLLYYCYARPVFYARSTVHVRTLPQEVDTQKIFHDTTKP